MPEGLVYINSWLVKDGDRCFQLMETNDPSLFQQWIEQWNDLVKFEIIEIEDKPQAGNSKSQNILPKNSKI